MKKISPALVYFLVLCAFFLLITSEIGFTETLISLAVFTLAGIVPWYFFIARFAPIEGFFEQISISTVFTIVGMAFSGFLASWTGIHFLVFIPTISISILGYLLLGIDPKRQLAKLKSSFLGIKSIHWFTLAGLTLITFAYLKNEYDSQPIKWDGVWSFYPDTLWQISIIGENISKSAKYFPYLSGVDLSYPWGLHSFLGTWANFSGSSAASILLVFWPALYALIAPLVLIVFGKTFTGAFYTGAVTIIVLLASGQFSIPGAEISKSPLIYPISPTFELGLLLLLSFATLSIRFLKKSITIPQLALLAALSFVAATTKSSNAPFIFVGILAWIIYNLIYKKKVNTQIYLALALIALSALTGYLLTSSNGTSSVTLDAFSFSPSNLPNSKVISFSILAIYVMSLSGSCVLIGSKFEDKRKLFTFSTVALFGILATALLGHPGKSQLYFLWTIYPLVIMLAVWGLGIKSKETKPLTIFLVLLASWIIPQLWRLIDIGNPTIIHWEPILIICNYLVVGITIILVINRHFGVNSSPLLALSIVLTCGIAMQSPELTKMNYSFPADDLSTNTLSSIDMKLLTHLKTISAPEDIIATDFHCSNIKEPKQDSIEKCDGKFFAISAFSERRTLISGWAYTQLSNSPLTTNLLKENDLSFSPQSINNLVFWKRNHIKWLIAENTKPIHDYLQGVATEIMSGDKMSLWKINQSR